jgi:hypothetical protein
MASGKSIQSKSFRSQKVGQTLQDLEAAFADWEALSETPATAGAAAIQRPGPESARNTDAPSAKDAELRKKTKELLNQLREQLAELAD